MARCSSVAGGFLLAALLTLGLPLPATAADPDAAALDSMIEVQQRARDSLDKKIEQYNELARQKQRESQSLLGRLNRLRQSAVESQAQMEQLEKENGRLRNSMGKINLRIADASNTLADLLIKLRGRVVDMYKYSSQEELNILLSTRDTHDALVTAYMLGCLTRQDQAVVENLAVKADELKLAKSRLETSRAQVQRQTEELRKKRTEFDTTIRQTNALLKNIQGQQKQARNAAQELVAAQQAIGNKIIALMQQKKARQGGAPSAPAPAKPGQPQKQPQKAKQPQNYAYLPKGTPLEWPIRGPISMAFGSRVHPVFKTKIFNSGIDIRAASGAAVKAAGPGEVLFRGWIRGFGQVVIIDHGNNISTVYAHLAATSVQEGDAVRTGTTVGTVGNSGASTEYGLHFEVRRDGAAQNPMNYLRRL